MSTIAAQAAPSQPHANNHITVADTVSPTAPATASANGSPSAPSDDGSAPPAAAKLRKLSAAAKEWTPPASSDHMQFPVTTPSASPQMGGHAGPAAGLEEVRDPDDAEDEDELAAFVAAAVASYRGSGGSTASSPADSGDSASAGKATGPADRSASTDSRKNAANARDSSLISKALCRQVEFLLSNQSLWKHAALQTEMQKDPLGQGHVSLASLASLKEVAAILNQTDPTLGLSLLTKGLAASEKLALSPDGSSVRRMRPLPSYESYKDSNRTIFVDRLPQGSTVRSVKRMFGRFGKVNYVLRADEILGATGQAVAEKGQLTPHTSPKLKGRSLSNDLGGGVGVSPSLLARRLSRQEGSPALSGMAGSMPALALGVPNLSHLSPAQRNRTLAAINPSHNPDSFTAAFIQFSLPSSAKKAVSSIVAYNKALKAATPKGTPRLAGRRASLGPGGIPPASLGHSAHSVSNMSADFASMSTPPRSRSIRINSPLLVAHSPKTLEQPTTGASNSGAPSSTSTAGGAAGNQSLPPPSPQRKRVDRVHDSASPEPLPPSAHSVLAAQAGTGAAPPRHATSPPPLHPMSPADREKQQRKRSVASSGVASPPFVPTTAYTSALSPAVSPTDATAAQAAHATHLAEGGSSQKPSVHFANEGALPELSLGGASNGAMAGGLNALLTSLPEDFIGIFTMPKISYLKSLKAKAAGLQSPTLGAMGSPGHAPTASPASTSVAKNAAAERMMLSPSGSKKPLLPPFQLVPVQTGGATERRSSVSNVPAAATQASASAARRNSASHVLSAKAAEFTPQLSAQAPVFTPSTILASASVPVSAPVAATTPVVAPAPTKGTPLLTAASSSPQQVQRVLKSNWRSDGTAPAGTGAASGAPTDFFDDPHSFHAKSPSLGPIKKSPALGPSTSPSMLALDEHGNPMLGSADKKQKKAKHKKNAPSADTKAGAGTSSSPADGAAAASDDSSAPPRAPKAVLEGERPKFSLTKRPSVTPGGVGAGGAGGVAGTPEQHTRQVVSRFALGPESVEAIGFAGRGRAMAQRASPTSMTGAGGGKPL